MFFVVKFEFVIMSFLETIKDLNLSIKENVRKELSDKQNKKKMIVSKYETFCLSELRLI